jgi:hypothetical protein
MKEYSRGCRTRGYKKGMNKGGEVAAGPMALTLFPEMALCSKT